QPVRVLLGEPMRAVAAGDWRTHYRPGVEQIAADCRRGLNVVFVTEGDPTVYSTAAPLWQLLRPGAPGGTRGIVPGGSSITAAAARVGWPLAQRDEMFAVAPASCPPYELRELLGRCATVCLLKASAGVLQRAALGDECEAVYLEELGGAQEWITGDLAA